MVLPVPKTELPSSLLVLLDSPLIENLIDKGVAFISWMLIVHFPASFYSPYTEEECVWKEGREERKNKLKYKVVALFWRKQKASGVSNLSSLGESLKQVTFHYLLGFVSQAKQETSVLN